MEIDCGAASLIGWLVGIVTGVLIYVLYDAGK